MCLNEGSSLQVQDFCSSWKVKLLFFCSGILWSAVGLIPKRTLAEVCVGPLGSMISPGNCGRDGTAAL